MTKINPVDAFVGARLREIRFQRRVSLNRLSSGVSLTPARILAYENGEERIAARVMFDLCSVLNVSPGEFFERSKNSATVDGFHKRFAKCVRPISDGDIGSETLRPEPAPYVTSNSLSHKGLSNK